MLRRKLFAYACMLIAGISVGFIYSEGHAPIKAAGLLICLAYVICAVDIDSKCDRNAERKALLICLLAGFLVFISAFINFNGQLRDINGDELSVDEVTEISGVIVRAESKDEGYRLTVNAEYPIEEKVLINVYEGNDDIEINNTCSLIGRRVECYGKLKNPSSRRNPLCFDYSVYLKSKGITHTFSAKSLEIKEYDDSRLWKYRRYIIEKRMILEDSFDNNPNIKAFVKGTVFGDKSEIDDDIIEEFNENSTGHILAVSGLHIGFLFSLLKLLSRKRKGLTVSIVIITIIFLYGEMTLWSASTVRAVTVMAVSLLSSHFLRKSDILTSVSAAAVTILIINPYQLFNSGFQMSFLAMLGISFITKPLSYIVGDWFALMLAVQIAVAPYTAYTFNRFNIVSILINIPIVFIASVMVPCCLVQLGIISITDSPIHLLNNLIEFLSELIIDINEKLNMEGIFSDKVISINAGILISIYLFLLLICSEWARVKFIRRDISAIRKVIAVMLVPCLCMTFCFRNEYAADSIVFVDVGQGACCHIRVQEGLFKEKNYIIDGGGNEEYNVGKNTVEAYLLKNGVDNIDTAFVTHLHTDHYKGICELAQEGLIDNLVVFEGNESNSDEIVADTGLAAEQIQYMCGGDFRILDSASNISSSDAYVEVLWPEKSTDAEYEKMLSEDDENSMSLVFKVNIEGVSIIITGDLDEEGEKSLVDTYGSELKSDILSVGHHGSKYSCCDEYLDTVDPELAVIQVGQNIYGHPTEETLDRLRSRNIEYYRNDKCGAVGINVAEGKIKSVHTMLDFDDSVV